MLWPAKLLSKRCDNEHLLVAIACWNEIVVTSTLKRCLQATIGIKISQ